ncbi:hypothetical protein [Subtercola lobariae]|uniref:site-specific DNA-methyltransferase (adenine-specific) n=1 Tax=Subtercola lobariae TaxID=1588641 RepID=A0A917B463_9MICO|nr:hypothetical protein [Subtercola lobariae]GGF17502.1 hypothetical protein GCM10011399_09050 [Subtercola lobariae]
MTANISSPAPPYLFGASRRRSDDLVLRTVPEFFGDYDEAFLGSGARALVMMRHHSDAGYRLHSASSELLAVWRALPGAVDEIAARVLEHAARHARSHFDEVRRSVEISDAERAARFIYLCGTAQGSGLANTADDFATARYGRDTVAFDEANVRAVGGLLADRDVRVDARPLFDQLADVREDDYVFLEPPGSGGLLPGSEVSTQRELKSYIGTVTARGAFLLYSEHPSTDGYGGTSARSVPAGGAAAGGAAAGGAAAGGATGSVPAASALSALAHSDGEPLWANGLLVRALRSGGGVSTGGGDNRYR